MDIVGYNTNQEVIFSWSTCFLWWKITRSRDYFLINQEVGNWTVL